MRPLIVVQCRSDSKRLPQKAFYPIAGVPCLVFLLRRLMGNLSADTFNIVVATTQRRSDDLVAIWGHDVGLPVIRGAENDLVARYLCCLEQYPADAVVRVTADNPLTCPLIIRRLIDAQQAGSFDYAHCADLPYGAGADVFSTRALQRIDAAASEREEREHINLHIMRHPSGFKTLSAAAPEGVARPDLRMTMDTTEDFERLRKLWPSPEPDPWRITLDEAIARMDRQSAG